MGGSPHSGAWAVRSRRRLTSRISTASWSSSTVMYVHWWLPCRGSPTDPALMRRRSGRFELMLAAPRLELEVAAPGRVSETRTRMEPWFNPAHIGAMVVATEQGVGLARIDSLQGPLKGIMSAGGYSC